jgi:hypothetical protein
MAKYSEGQRSWIPGAVVHPGEAHRMTGTPAGKPIPEGKLTQLIKRLRKVKNKTSTQTHELRALDLAKTLKRLSAETEYRRHKKGE